MALNLVTTFVMDISQNIKDAAKAHNKTITQIASALGVLQPQLSRTINNPRITLADMQKIAQAIGCSVADFMKDDEAQQVEMFCPHCGKAVIITAKKEL